MALVLDLSLSMLGQINTPLLGHTGLLASLILTRPN